VGVRAQPAHPPIPVLFSWLTFLAELFMEFRIHLRKAVIPEHQHARRQAPKQESDILARGSSRNQLGRVVRSWLGALLVKAGTSIERVTDEWVSVDGL